VSEWIYGFALFCKVGWLIDNSVAAFVGQMNAAIDNRTISKDRQP
jgi:hypothetical protein